MKVLIVDDEPSVAAILRIMLEKHGFEVQVVHSGAEALNKAAGFDPDVLICDLQMPGLSGVELSRHLHYLLPNCRKIWISGYAGPEILESPSAHGLPVTLLTKPVSQSDLLQALSTTVAS